MDGKTRTIIFFIGLIFIGIATINLIMYSVILKKKIEKSEKIWPKKGEKCFCYVYNVEQGDNDSVIFSVVAYLASENINKILKYQTFNNIKLKCNQVVNGYYYKNKVVLDKKSIPVNELPQNIIDVFELNNEETI